MVKHYFVYLAKPNIILSDAYEDLKSAIFFANCNLYSRFGIKVHGPFITGVVAGPVMISVTLPDYIKDDFNPGPRLRGISSWLLDKSSNKDIYKACKVGHRLLYFVEASQSQLTRFFEHNYQSVLSIGNRSI